MNERHAVEEEYTMTASRHTPGTGVIITGGASGIGLACAEALAAVGRPVAIWDLREADATRVASAIAAAHGVPAVGLGIDLRRVDGIDAAVGVTRHALPSIGALVHAAGVSHALPLDRMELADWDDVLNVNLRAMPFVVKAIHADLKENPGSAIVGIASINATLGNAMNPAYTASKGGLLSLVRSLADWLGPDGIRINSVSPGQIDTPMMRPALETLPPGYFEKRILLGRLGRPSEIAAVVRFLLSDEASYVTASEIVADGGNISSQRG